MSLNWTTYQAALANLAGTQTTNSYFQIELGNAIDYAELRILRDLDLLTMIVADASQVCVPNFRLITAPSAFVVVNGVNIITPAGTAPNNGMRNQVVKCSEDFIDMAWPSSADATVPTKFALQTQLTILFGPWPDQAYTVEIIGTQRPLPLSASNTSTFISTYLPDLFLAASMIHIAAYQKNFGAQADDPRMAMSWETQYEKLLDGCNAEELRKRYAGTIAKLPPGMKAPAMPGR
jgi:hypothetical protein